MYGDYYDAYYGSYYDNYYVVYTEGTLASSDCPKSVTVYDCGNSGGADGGASAAVAVIVPSVIVFSICGVLIYRRIVKAKQADA